MKVKSRLHKDWQPGILVALSVILSGLSLGKSDLAVQSTKAAFPGENGKIAFVEYVSALKAIDPDGSDEQTLVGSGASPAWSPDGEKIAYMAYGVGGIYIANADGSDPQFVTSNGDNPAWSPDGAKIAFRGPDCVLWIHDMASGLNTQLTTLDPTATSECHFSPAWKPNGSQIVFTRMIFWEVAFIKYDLWMVNDNGTGLTKLTDVSVGDLEEDPGCDNDPKWSPDGTQIVFSRDEPSVGVYTISSGGGSPTWLASTGNLPRPYPSWSPDGEKIAYIYFNRTPNPHTYEIHVMDEDGSNDQMILSKTNQIVTLDWGVEAMKEFVVNSDDNRPDNDVGDGECDTGEVLDGGDAECTLFAAIDESNFDPGKDNITFDIPGGGTPRIQAPMGEPEGGWAFEVKYPVVIDASTQPESGKVEIRGAYDACEEAFLECTCRYDGDPVYCFGGFKITAGDSTLRDLVINGMTEWAVYLTGGGGNVLEGNFIGVDSSGTSAMGNGRIYFEEGEEFGWGGGGVLIESSGNRIGGLDHPIGTCSGACNLISGNTLVDTPEVDLIQLPTGVSIRGSAATGNMIYGNFIGVDLNGQQVPSGLAQYEGIFIGENPGTLNEVKGNLISGNRWNAVHIEDGGQNTIQGNLIGIKAGGMGGMNSPQQIGAQISESEGNLLIDNVISDFIYGIFVAGVGSVGNEVRENKIGTTADGVYALGNEEGIYIVGESEGVAPTNTDVLTNTIAFNDIGVRLIDGSTASTIEGNSIHDNEYGVWTLDSSDNEITRNSIFDNDLGIWIERSGPGEQATGIRISANSIYGNRNWTRSGLGIDLASEGPNTPNDLGDSDEGANNKLNFPALGFAAVESSGDLRIGGSFDSILGSHPYRIELFANNACDESGFGEGETFLGYANVTTDLSGRTVFDFTKAQAGVGLGQFLTATAIDEDSNTSEFSRCVEAQPGTYLTSNAGIGSTTLQVNSTQGFLIGDLVRINPGGANQEDHLVVGFSSLLLDSPLLYDHLTGEPVIVISERIYLPAAKR